MADTHQDFAIRINAILERLTQLTARIFDFSLRGFPGGEAFPDLRQFWFKFKDEPVGLEILQMTVTSLLPRALTKGLLFKKLLENVGELVDKHCGRLRYDFHQRLQESPRDSPDLARQDRRHYAQLPASPGTGLVPKTDQRPDYRRENGAA